ncbi:MAG: glycoside hydrolase family 2 TIM barrel-domain containing protein [Mycobacteriales bacterium]
MPGQPLLALTLWSGMTLPPQATSVSLDELGCARLDGSWEFFPGDHQVADLDGLDPEPIVVPGLWESHGHLELDGVAWYRRRFSVEDPSGWWTLRFGAVMDTAHVYLNGAPLGSHRHPFTPFEMSVTGLLRAGVNVVDVRVCDPAVDDPRHVRSAHGKQGWANQVFPSPPSLYMTFGGIWQPVTLRKHGRVVAGAAFLSGDPDDLTGTVEITNLSTAVTEAVVSLRTLGLVATERLRLGPGQTRTVNWRLGATTAARWSPESPTLHDALVDVEVEGTLTDRHRLRFGLRTLRMEHTRMLINGVPYRMKSALVQGFRAEELYAEGSREAIIAEVRAAQQMGFTMLRLHIKGFDPSYLDVCDELGMLVHSDLPIAEPIAHDELGDGTALSADCADAVTEQVRRDRNHPCIVLWSAMNELGLEGHRVREGEQYEQFARTIYSAIVAADPTRPVIENDWIDPDPQRVFCSPILTAHWYGRLHADYLAELERKAAAASALGRPFFVTELGDWGLPEMPLLDAPPFWDARATYANGLVATRWPGTLSEFVRGTQRYQGLSDRLQIEVLRRYDHIGGYCLTELTDVPQEFNGLLDLHREPKPLAVAEITRANQPVLPMLALTSHVVRAGGSCEATLHIANDGPALRDVEVEARVGAEGDVKSMTVGDLPGHAVMVAGTLSVRVPQSPGGHDVVLTLRAGGTVIAGNRYPLHVVTEPAAPYPVHVLGEGSSAEALLSALPGVGAVVGDSGPAFVPEGMLDEGLAGDVADRLQAGGTVVILAQQVSAAGHYPVPVELVAVETEWGSSVYDFTTGSGALPSLPRRQLLVAEEATVQARSVIVRIAGHAFPDEPVVIAYKPVPGSITGTVVGLHHVGTGRLLLCQYRLAAGAASSDAMAAALLADLVRWAADPRPPTTAERTSKDDGRALTYYSFPASR